MGVQKEPFIPIGRDPNPHRGWCRRELGMHKKKEKSHCWAVPTPLYFHILRTLLWESRIFNWKNPLRSLQGKAWICRWGVKAQGSSLKDSCSWGWPHQPWMQVCLQCTSSCMICHISELISVSHFLPPAWTLFTRDRVFKPPSWCKQVRILTSSHFGTLRKKELILLLKCACYFFRIGHKQKYILKAVFFFFEQDWIGPDGNLPQCTMFSKKHTYIQSLMAQIDDIQLNFGCFLF